MTVAVGGGLRDGCWFTMLFKQHESHTTFPILKHKALNTL